MINLKNKKIIILFSVVFLCLISLFFILAGCNNQANKDKYAGNWCLITEVPAQDVNVPTADIDALIAKGIDQKKLSVVSLYNNGSYEISSLGKISRGTYDEKKDGFEFKATPLNSNSEKMVALKFDNDNLRVYSDDKEIGKLERCDYSALDASMEINRVLGRQIINFSEYMGSVDNLSADEVSQRLNTLQGSLKNMSPAERETFIHDIQSNHANEVSVAFSKLNKNQKDDLKYLLDEFSSVISSPDDHS